MLGYAYTDTAVFGRTYDQRQWAHAFGVSLLPARTTDAANEFANVLRWQFGTSPEAKTYEVLVQSPLIFFTGVHLAGPHLTAQTFRAGLFSYPSSPTTSPTVLHTSWGRHGIWPSTDYTWGDDLTVIWWDPNATGPDEVGNEGRGMYRYALDGRRYLPGHWPAQVGLFDDASSVTIFNTLPPGSRPPNYPSPTSAPGMTRYAAVHDARRIADRDAEVGQRPGDDRAGADDDMPADHRPGQHDGAVPEPGARPDRTPARAARTDVRSACADPRSRWLASAT